MIQFIPSISTITSLGRQCKSPRLLSVVWQADPTGLRNFQSFRNWGSQRTIAMESESSLGTESAGFEQKNLVSTSTGTIFHGLSSLCE